MFEFVEDVVLVMELLAVTWVWLFGSAASGMDDRRLGVVMVVLGCECMRVCGLVTPVTTRRQVSIGSPSRKE